VLEVLDEASDQNSLIVAIVLRQLVQDLELSPQLAGSQASESDSAVSGKSDIHVQRVIDVQCDDL